MNQRGKDDAQQHGQRHRADGKQHIVLHCHKKVIIFKQINEVVQTDKMNRRQPAYQVPFGKA
ncbi:hypothetical protein D3C75_1139280 [compost metagenome]